MIGYHLSIELERVWKEAAVTLIKTIISWHLHGETEENHEKHQGRQCPSQNSN
jgi:hypothetical protein